MHRLRLQIMVVLDAFSLSAYAQDSQPTEPPPESPATPVRPVADELYGSITYNLGAVASLRGLRPVMGVGLVLGERYGTFGIRIQLVELAGAISDESGAGGVSVVKLGTTLHPLQYSIFSPYVGGAVGFGSWGMPAEAEGIGSIDGSGVEVDALAGIVVPLGAFRLQVEAAVILPGYTLTWDAEDGGAAPELDKLYHARGALRISFGRRFRQSVILGALSGRH
jgi:hypothetical protein